MIRLHSCLAAILSPKPPTVEQQSERLKMVWVTFPAAFYLEARSLCSHFVSFLLNCPIIKVEIVPKYNPVMENRTIYEVIGTTCAED